MSALLLHKATGAKVSCVDIDVRAVEAAKEMISKLGLSDRIDVILTSPTESTYIDLLNGNEVVWIASLVFGKNRTLHALRDKLKQVLKSHHHFFP